MNPNGNPQNLKPFKKGENGGSKGRPVGIKDRRTILKKLIEVASKFNHPITEEEITGTVEERLNWSLIQKGLAGDVQAIKEINDTLYGKIPDKSETEHKGKIIIDFIND